MSLAGLLRVCTTYDLCAIFNGLCGVESTLLSGETLEENLCVRVDFEVLDGVGVVKSG